ncbi:MAG: hypothetical protein HC898_07525 [Phycisphaerales bacterium]|nr:hypothetical protein [Phycisphaerales bacterium]
MSKPSRARGFDFATGDPTKFHSPSAFTVQGCRVELKKSGRAFTTAFADVMAKLMKQDQKITAVTAAMPDGTGLSKLLPMFPDRVFDTGICESHAMDMCAGMAKTGLKPFFAVYSTFAQRALDQVFQEISLQGLPVRIVLDRAGFVGEDGAVHHGFMDISMFAPLPGVVMLACSDEPNMLAALEFMSNYEQGSTVLRYPRANVPDVAVQSAVEPYVLGKGVFIHRSGNRPDPLSSQGAREEKPNLAILAYGTQVYDAFEAIQKELDPQGYDIALYDPRFAKPVDVEMLRGLIDAGISILTVEDHALRGGFGACVLEACHDHGLPTGKLHRLAMPEKWITPDTRKAQLAEVGLDSAGIARKVRLILDSHAHGSLVPVVSPVRLQVRAPR